MNDVRSVCLFPCTVCVHLTHSLNSIDNPKIRSTTTT